MTPTTQHAFEPEEVMVYLGGELEARCAAALATHLDHCAECRSLAKQFRAITERMFGFQVEAPSPKFHDAVHAALVRHNHSRLYT